MRAFGLLGMAAVLVLATGSITLSQDQKDNPLLGTWELKEKVADKKELVGRLHFADKNKMTITIMDISFDGTYEIEGPGSVKMSFTLGEKKVSEKAKFTVKDNVLELTGPSGKAEKFMRVAEKK